jgi:phosphomannomutase/phosphoglucomutase
MDYDRSNPPGEIFKAYDIRGIVGRTLNEALVRDLGQAIGSEARQQGQGAMIIGRDGRLSGPSLSAAVAEGILASGCNVIDIGQVPTPLVYFAANTLDTQSGISLTGSHNPPDYNGLKIMIAGNTLAGDTIQDLRRRVVEDDLMTGSGSLTKIDIIDDYIDYIKTDVQLARPLKIVIDAGNGVAGAVAPQLFKALGCDVTCMYCEVDGTFPNHHPDPSQPETLEDLIKTVADTGADFGMAFDGDGDRLGVVAPSGEIIWPDRQMLLFSKDILKRNPGAEIIFDVKCSRILPATIEAAGGKATMWKTGHSLIKAKLRETGAAIAGEMSGHIFFKERWFGFDDGLYAGARLCELMAASEQSCDAIFSGLPNTVNTPELRLEMPEGEHHKLVAELLAADHSVFDDGKVSTIDGLRVDFNDGFALARASNTTPMIIMRFEADDEPSLDRIQNQFRAFIMSVRPGIALPF